jgi:hypothetical protein
MFTHIEHMTQWSSTMLSIKRELTANVSVQCRQNNTAEVLWQAKD